MVEPSNPTIQLTLNRNAVVAPVSEAAAVCREIVDFCFNSIVEADLSKPPPRLNSFFRFETRLDGLDATARRSLYESWILAKAFQDLMRGARASLEQAYVITTLTSQVHSVKSDSTLDDLFSPIALKAGKKKFPDLLKRVNSKLTTPLEFAGAYQSMQDARNCLEHRNGIVGKPDVNGGDAMYLTFPRAKMFYYRGEEEIELCVNERVDAQDGKPEVHVLMRLDVRERVFKLGERIILNSGDFEEIVFACWYFASQLAQRLPG